MQFITTDNRIAVENFQIGYFYTITFNNHNYIITTCTGKGDNFVSFLCSEPELVFDLTMQTADSIATIELYGGGTGTTDYNNLSNKPTINNVLLVGNKTTSDLQINDVPTVTSADDSKVLLSSYSGGVGSYSWETYSPISSYNDLTDKPTINSVTLSGNKTSSDLGIQSEINSENPLLSDNVDDTDQTHKFATAAQIAQITTNQNNISLIKHATNTSIYIQETRPTGAIGDYWISSTNGVKVYGRTYQLFNRAANDPNNGYIGDGYLISTGEKFDNSEYRVSEYIPCTEGTTYTVVVGRIVNNPSICFYDENYTYISGNSYNGNSSVQVTAPTNAVYMRGSYNTNDSGSYMIYEGTETKSYIAYYDWS